MAQRTLEQLQDEMVATIIGNNKDIITGKICGEVEKELLKKFGVLPETHVIRMGRKTKKMAETTHEKFDEVLKIVANNIPVYLTGKAGTGKNVICQQVAKALDLDFYFTNAVTQEYKLTGFIDANGNYQKTQFYEAFTNGGLFFLDEMDASVPEVLVILNAAIANGYFDFPNGKKEAHEDFRVIAAGNTTGLGADVNYTGRYCLDRASLDRFAMVNIDYSPKIEKAMSLGDEELINFCHWFRSATDRAGVECLFSYRTINRIAKLKDEFDMEEVLNISLLKGLPMDDIDLVRRRIADYENNYKENPYYNALYNIVNKKK